MDLVKYEVFVKTVECGSLSDAARALGYTQSNVSHIIQSLEAHMGISLMHRSKSGIVLTEQGQQLLPMMYKVLEDNDQMENKAEELKNRENGILRIGTFTDAMCEGLPECLKRFRRDYPKIRIEMVNLSCAEIEDSLKKGMLDVGFLTDNGHLKVDFLPLYREELRAVLPDAEPFCNLSAYPVKRCAEDSFIYPTHSLQTYVDAVMEAEHVRPCKALEVYGDDAVIAMVENELGVSILPEQSLTHRRGRLLSLPLAPRQYRAVGIGTSGYGTNEEIVCLFIKYLREAVREQESDLSAG